MRQMCGQAVYSRATRPKRNQTPYRKIDMNKVFKVIWNHATQTWTAVSEISHAHGKKSASDKRKAVTAAVAAAGALMASGAAQAGVETSASTITIKSDNPNNVVGTNQGTRNINIGTGANTYRTEAGNVLSHDSIAIGSDATGTGDKAVAIGKGANATKENGIAIGFSATNQSIDSVAIGREATSSKDMDVAIGKQAQASGGESLAFGSQSKSSGPAAVAVGKESNAAGSAAVATGYQADAKGANTVATGKSSTASVDNAVAVGVQSNASARAATALGGYSAASADRATAVGAASKATGTASFAGGTSANAAGVNSVAVGGSMTPAEAAQAAGANSVAVGSKSNAQQAADIAVGHGATANGTSTGSNAEGATNNAGSAMAIGTDSQATGIVATAIGQRSQALANGAVALGGDAQAKQGSDVAIGRGSVADGTSASAFGPAAQATGKYSVALGVQSQATSEQAIALGRLSQANGKFATALGNNAQATAQNTLALGTEAKSTIENSVALGNGSTTNAFVPTSSATVGSYTYGGFAGATSGLGNGAVLSVGSAGNERQIQNVAAGRISATSTDAINGSQLYAVANRIENLNPFVFSGHNGSGSSPAEGTFKYNPNSANNPLKLIAGEGLKMTSNGTNEYTLSVIGGGATGATGATGAKGDKGDPGKDGKDADGTFGLRDEENEEINKPLNNTIQIKGDAGTKVQVFDKATGKTSEKEVQNIFVKKDGDALKVSLNPDLTVNSVTTNELKAGPVTINQGGIDAGNTTIKNVAPGKNGTDAVNVDQLNQKFGDVNSNVNKVDNNARAGVAQALATAGLPQAYLPGKSMLAIGGGHYRGETGYAVGFSSISDGGNWIIKGTASGNSRGHFGATAAVGYQW